MMSQIIVSFFSGLFLGTFLFFFYSRLLSKKHAKKLQQQQDLIINRAKSEAAKIERLSQKKAKDYEEKLFKDLDKETVVIKEELKNKEHKLKQRETQIQTENQLKQEEFAKSEQELLDQREYLQNAEKKLELMQEKVKQSSKELSEALENVAGMTKEEAQTKLEKALEDQVKSEISPRLLEIENKLKEESKQKAQLLVAQAMVRYAAEVTAERTVERVPIPSSSSKGKIIGREGRNIRALESACGVDIVIEEGQDVVTVSCFDPVRRSVAKKTLEKLMEEGRVHPALIEETVSKIRKEIIVKMKEEGEKTCFDTGVHNVNPRIIETLGSLKYRFIEDQNLLKCSVEVSHICSLIAAELHLNTKKARRMGLLHAIGMGVPHAVEGSYSAVGADFCRKHGEKPDICQAIRAHDGKAEAKSLYDHVVQIAYNLSRSRHNVKRSSLDNFINRLKDLESLANSFDGISRSFAIQAGKEIRVLVDSNKVTKDHQMNMLSRDIARKIEREMNVDGEVKVSVLREYRIIEHAR